MGAFLGCVPCDDVLTVTLLEKPVGPDVRGTVVEMTGFAADAAAATATAAAAAIGLGTEMEDVKSSLRRESATSESLSMLFDLGLSLLVADVVGDLVALFFLVGDLDVVAGAFRLLPVKAPSTPASASADSSIGVFNGAPAVAAAASAAVALRVLFAGETMVERSLDIGNGMFFVLKLKLCGLRPQPKILSILLCLLDTSQRSLSVRCRGSHSIEWLGCLLPLVYNAAAMVLSITIAMVMVHLFCVIFQGKKDLADWAQSASNQHYPKSLWSKRTPDEKGKYLVDVEHESRGVIINLRDNLLLYGIA